MHVPDSITVGPSRPNLSRIQQDHERATVWMEVPESIRLGKKKNFKRHWFFHLKIEDNHANANKSNNPTEHSSDVDDDDYAGLNHQPIHITDS